MHPYTQPGSASLRIAVRKLLGRALITIVVVMAISGSLNVPLYAQTPTQGTLDPGLVRFLFGLSQARMTDFNRKLEAEGNKTIGKAITLAFEANLPVPVAPLKDTLRLPIGAEVLLASSKTVHTLGGASATVNWSLPVVGVYLSPAVQIRPRKLLYYFRPGVGYYWLGNKWFDSNLSVTDRAGSLEARAKTAGGFVLIGGDYPLKNGFSLLFEGGYRWLRFGDVKLNPRDGFVSIVPGGVAVQPGNLPETLDYSGIVFRIGLGFHP